MMGRSLDGGFDEALVKCIIVNVWSSARGFADECRLSMQWLAIRADICIHGLNISFGDIASALSMIPTFAGPTLDPECPLIIIHSVRFNAMAGCALHIFLGIFLLELQFLCRR